MQSTADDDGSARSGEFPPPPEERWPFAVIGALIGGFDLMVFSVVRSNPLRNNDWIDRIVTLVMYEFVWAVAMVALTFLSLGLFGDNLFSRFVSLQLDWAIKAICWIGGAIALIALFGPIIGAILVIGGWLK